MREPTIAADGMTYEHEAISRWIEAGHRRSPVTNAVLDHTVLSRSHALKGLIADWRAGPGAEIVRKMQEGASL